MEFEKVVKAIRERKTQVGGGAVWVVIDLVAYAPHRSIDVKKWDVDFAVFSWYKVRHLSMSLTLNSYLGLSGLWASYCSPVHQSNGAT